MGLRSLLRVRFAFADPLNEGRRALDRVAGARRAVVAVGPGLVRGAA